MTGKEQVQLLCEEAPQPPAGGLLVRTRKSLISTGTECICYRSEMDEGSHWAGWVRYPFNLGYSNVARVEEVGPQAEGFEPGDRIFTTSSHHQWIAAAGNAIRIPDDISDEEAAWSKLATIAQTGVRRAQLEMGARVVVIGLGPLGQLITQYARVMGAEEILAIDPIAGRLEIARAHTAARAIGVARGALEDAVAYALERKQFGRPISEFQAIRFKIADMAAEIAAARQLLYFVCTEIDQGRRCDKEASMVKLFASEMAERVTSEAIQIFGGAGYTTHCAVERYWRDARLTKIFEGTSEIQRRIISDNLLGKPNNQFGN